MFWRRWDDCIATLKRHLALPSATWKAERAASMRFIARCYGEKGDAARQECYLWRAINEEPGQREAALELAEFANRQKDWHLLVAACERCLAVTRRKMTYLTKAEAWGSRPYDLYAVGLWYTGRKKEAIEANETAMKLNPNDQRLKDNDAIMRSLITEGK
jgi:tetratricopeptide (TPR) repeat protein